MDILKRLHKVQRTLRKCKDIQSILQMDKDDMALLIRLKAIITEEERNKAHIYFALIEN